MSSWDSNPGPSDHWLNEHFFSRPQVFIFKEDEEEEIELPFTEEELKEKFDGKLEKEMKGPTYEVLSKLMKVSSNIFSSLLSTRFPSAGLSAAHFHADWLLYWSLAAKWAQLLITLLTAAYSAH